MKRWDVFHLHCWNVTVTMDDTTRWTDVDNWYDWKICRIWGWRWSEIPKIEMAGCTWRANWFDLILYDSTNDWCKHSTKLTMTSPWFINWGTPKCHWTGLQSQWERVTQSKTRQTMPQEWWFPDFHSTNKSHTGKHTHHSIVTNKGIIFCTAWRSFLPRKALIIENWNS